MDLRIKKTYRALFDAFTELLEEHRFEDLTVAMLCDRAMIRRTTFYKHFRDKNDYFAFYIDELMSGLPQKQPDEAGAVSAEDVRALRHAILDDAMDLILTHHVIQNLVDDSLALGRREIGRLLNIERRLHRRTQFRAGKCRVDIGADTRHFVVTHAVHHGALGASFHRAATPRIYRRCRRCSAGSLNPRLQAHR